jgi:hypothetical protein
MSFTWRPECGSPFSNPHLIKGVNDATPFEVAQLERLTRRMDYWQRGFLQAGSLWDALITKRQRTAAEPFVFTLCSKNFGQHC